MPLSPKNVIFISEALLLNGIVPQDILDPERFELRSIQLAKEMIILAKIQKPLAIVLDLDSIDRDLKQFIQELSNPTPILGVTETQKSVQMEKLYESGISMILTKPVTTAILQEALESLLGFRFRKSERKRVFGLLQLMDMEEKSFAVTLQIVNHECFLVIGTDLPHLGTNLRVSECKLLQNLPDDFVLWVHAWKMVEEGLLLRFLNPSPLLMDCIQKLPVPYTDIDDDENLSDFQMDTGEYILSMEGAQIKTQSLVHLDDPGIIGEINLAGMNKYLQDWVSGKKAPPAWEENLQHLPDLEQTAFHPPAGNEKIYAPISLAATLRILLKAQLDNLRGCPAIPETLDEANVQRILDSHSTQAKRISKILQNSLVDFIAQGKTDTVNQINQLKTDIQKMTVVLKNTLTQRGLLSEMAEEPSTPPKTKPEPQAAEVPLQKPQPSRIILLAVLMVCLLFMILRVAIQ